jgi:hypothetical protein
VDARSQGSLARRTRLYWVAWLVKVDFHRASLARNVLDSCKCGPLGSLEDVLMGDDYFMSLAVCVFDTTRAHSSHYVSLGVCEHRAFGFSIQVAQNLVRFLGVLKS